MAVKLRHLLIADSVLLDSITGKASAIGLFDVINIEPNQPSRIASFSILGQLVFDELPTTQTSVLVVLKSPDGEPVKEGVPLTLEPPSQDTATPLHIPFVVNFSGIEINQIGNYEVEITVDGFTPEAQEVGTFQAVKLNTPT